jgi:hypothetical protein
VAQVAGELDESWPEALEACRRVLQAVSGYLAAGEVQRGLGQVEALIMALTPPVVVAKAG